MSVLVPATFPSVTSVFVAAAASVLLLLVARILYLLARLWSCPIARPESQDKDSPVPYLPFIAKPWGLPLRWNTLPASLPFSLVLPEKPSPQVGNGVSSVRKLPQTLPVVNWQPRTGPQFQPPPPALYESPVPLSMAKMIMSRHTFRKPNPNRTRRSSTGTPSSHPTSPPQTPSRLYHSIA